MNNIKKILCLIIFSATISNQAFSVITDKDINTARNVINLITLIDSIVLSKSSDDYHLSSNKKVNTNKLNKQIKFIPQNLSINLSPVLLNELLAASINDTDYTQEMIDFAQAIKTLIGLSDTKIDLLNTKFNDFEKNTHKYIDAVSANFNDKSLKDLVSSKKEILLVFVNSLTPILARFIAKMVVINSTNNLLENHALAKRITNILSLSIAEFFAIYLNQKLTVQLDGKIKFSWNKSKLNTEKFNAIYPIFIKNILTQVLGEVINKLLIASPEKQRHELFQKMVQENFQK